MLLNPNSNPISHRISSQGPLRHNSRLQNTCLRNPVLDASAASGHVRHIPSSQPRPASCRGAVLRTNNCWNFDFFEAVFGIWAENIAALVKTNNFGQDFLEWLPLVSVHKPEKYIYESQFISTDNCAWVWSLPIRPREKIFMWRILKDAIPTTSWLRRRHLGNSNSIFCPWGCGDIEDISHIICKCKFTNGIRSCFADYGFDLISPPSFLEFISYIMNVSNGIYTYLHISTIYHAWRARNCKVHGKTYQTPNFITSYILNSLQSINLHSNNRNWDTIHPTGFSASWYPPPGGWIKVNFDGSFIANDFAAIGVIVRDHDGKLIKAFGRKIVASSPLDCELMAAASLVSILDESMLEAHGLILEGDSLEACKFIKKSIHVKGSILDARLDFSFILNFSNVVINFIRREFNRAADFCAKTARVENFLLLHDHPLPNELVAIMESDYG